MSTGSEMPLREYIYVDVRRLETYAEQIGPTTVYGHVPKWTLGFSLAGPTASRTQERPPTPLTRTDKVKHLLEYLKNGRLLENGRISDTTYFSQQDRVFRVETCVAVSVHIPARKAGDSSFAGLTMWVSERDNRGESHPLLLIEDFAGADHDTFEPMSAYSTLLALSGSGYDLKRSFENAGVGPFADLERKRLAAEKASIAVELDPGNLIGGGKFDSNLLESAKKNARAEAESRIYLESLARLSEEALKERLSTDLVGFFEWLGARIGPRRSIETLYRVRQVFFESTRIKHSDSIVTIGYPIFISPAGSAI